MEERYTEDIANDLINELNLLIPDHPKMDDDLFCHLLYTLEEGYNLSIDYDNAIIIWKLIQTLSNSDNNLEKYII